ncbi:hypothetical protein H0H92_010200, partial [Tricholoma furcatifolium]
LPSTPITRITPPNSNISINLDSSLPHPASPWSEANSIYRTPTSIAGDESTAESTLDESSPPTPPIPTIPPALTRHTDMPDLDLQPFHGDRDDESPRDFINSIKKFFMFGRGREESDADKIAYFSFSLKDGGTASAWFANLEAEKKQWASLLAAFDERWPGTQAAEKTQSEQQDELMEAKLTEEDLGKKVTVKGVEVYSHVAWADRVERAAKAIPDTNNLLVKSTQLHMPPTLCALWTLASQATQTPARTDTEKWTIVQRLARPDPASDMSRAAYRTAINQWHAANPRSYAANEDRPYPLTPGTAPLGSGECTGCGHTGHLENACTAASHIPQIESRWRRKVDLIRRAVNAPVVAVNLVNTADILPPGITHEQLRAILDAYLADHDAQGKAEGSSD